MGEEYLPKSQATSEHNHNSSDLLLNPRPQPATNKLIGNQRKASGGPQQNTTETEDILSSKGASYPMIVSCLQRGHANASKK
jgi:hypothetical protein